MIIPDGAEAPALLAAAKDRCGAAAFCKVLGWTDPTKVAKALPMLDGEAEAVTFSYTFNRATGYEQTLWDCRVFPQADRAQCL